MPKVARGVRRHANTQQVVRGRSRIRGVPSAGRVHCRHMREGVVVMFLPHVCVSACCLAWRVRASAGAVRLMRSCAHLPTCPRTLCALCCGSRTSLSPALPPAVS